MMKRGTVRDLKQRQLFIFRADWKETHPLQFYYWLIINKQIPFYVVDGCKHL